MQIYRQEHGRLCEMDVYKSHLKCRLELQDLSKDQRLLSAKLEPESVKLPMWALAAAQRNLLAKNLLRETCVIEIRTFLKDFGIIASFQLLDILNHAE